MRTARHARVLPSLICIVYHQSHTLSMIYHIITPHGREKSVALKLEKLVSRSSLEYSLTYDKKDGERYNQGFVLLELEGDFIEFNAGQPKISNIIAVKPINPEEKEAFYYLPLAQLSYDEDSDGGSLSIGKGYTIKEGPFKELSITVNSFNEQEVEGLVNIFGRETEVKLPLNYII